MESDLEPSLFDTAEGGSLIILRHDRSKRDPSDREIVVDRYAPVDIKTLPTLCPLPIAKLITILSTTTRLSIQAASLIVEMVLEGSQYTTQLSLGTFRRVMIAAISCARHRHLITANANLLTEGKIGDPQADPASTENFLDILDRYTNLGIYAIHHAFSLAELFAMTGFHLGSSALTVANQATQHSITVFNSIFGSTDSSRALAAIISLLRREMLDDERFKDKDKGKIKTLTALTKALTAFVFLQAATWETTSKKHKMKILYDCTVVKDKGWIAPHDPSEEKRKVTDEERQVIEEVDGRLWAHVNSTGPTQDDTTESDTTETSQHEDDYFEMTETFAESTTVIHTCNHRMQSATGLLLQLEGDSPVITEQSPEMQVETTTGRTISRKRTFRRLQDDYCSIPWFSRSNRNRSRHTTAIVPFTPAHIRMDILSLIEQTTDPVSPEPSTPQAPPPSPLAPQRDLDPAPPYSRSHRRLPSLRDVRIDDCGFIRTKEDLPKLGTDAPQNLFPHDSLLRNIHRFMRFSSAAYGQSFLRLLGLGSTDFTFPSTVRHHANTWSFAQHTKLPIDSMILSSFTETTPTIGPQNPATLVHYLAVDHNIKSVILTCRGTLGLSDVLTDLTCDYCSVNVEGPEPHAEYFAHSGMYRSALGLTSRKSSVHQAIVATLAKYQDYGLIVTGHSLGGGVAGLLSIVSSMPAKLFLEQNRQRDHPVSHPPISTPFVTSFGSGLPAGRPVHCYTYGVPAIASPDLAKYSKGLISSVIHNNDVVPSLSLGVLRDLKNISLTLFEEGNVVEEIVAKVLGLYTKRFKDDSSSKMEKGVADESTNGWMISLIKTMRADMNSDKLYPPGDVYIMEYHDVFVNVATGDEMQLGGRTISHKQAQRVTLQRCESVMERFGEPLFSKTMLRDHMPTHYERATQLLVDGTSA